MGDISCGKKLFLALMGSFKLHSGETALHGTIGHVPQVPWVFWDSSVASNVTLNDEPDKDLLKDILARISVGETLASISASRKKILSHLDFGTRQLHQISVARSLYRKPNLLLIEDIFSSFNAEQVQKLLNHGLFSQEYDPPSVLLLTQHKSVLSACDQVIVMKNGEILECGTPGELEKKGVNFSCWVTNYDVDRPEAAPPASAGNI